MEKSKRIFTLLLVFAILVTSIPLSASAATTTEEFIAMTVGQELQHKVKNQEYYVFSPETSGWYNLHMSDNTAGNQFTAGVYQTIYYTQTGEVKEEHTKKYSGYSQSNVSKTEHIMWLNQEESYVFYCKPDKYENQDMIDISLQIDKVEISGMEVVQAPTEPSEKEFNAIGMQVKLLYTDNKATVSGVVYHNSSYHVEALRWSDIAWKKNESIVSSFAIRSIDGKEYYGTNIEELESGEHTIGLGIYHSISGTGSSYYELSTTFEKSADNIDTITIVNKQDSYTAWFGQTLGSAEIKVTYNDSTPSTTIPVSNYVSGSSNAYQYLSYESEIEGPDGETYSTQTGAIDTYLQNGGKIGEATVTIEYAKHKVTYSITIAENPYNGIEKIEPNRTVYYANAGYNGSNADTITASDVGKITLTRKDGSESVTYNSINSVPGTIYYSSYGIKWNGRYYQNIDLFLKAGGTTGEQQLEVAYLNNILDTPITATVPIEIRENPYTSITIEQEPTKKTYTYSKYGSKIDFSGLVIVAQKEDGTCDKYIYGDNDNSTGIEGWRRYFHSSYEKNNCFGKGAHTIDFTFMNVQMKFDITIEEATTPTFSEFKIIKAPERTIYFTEEKESSVYPSSCVSSDGLEVEAVNSDGIKKKYKKGYEPSGNEDDLEGYSSWSEISWYIDIDDSQINWSQPGTYPVAVNCQEQTATYEVTIADSPIVSFEVLEMPDKTMYYEFERGSTNYQGLSYQITFDDGSLFAETINSSSYGQFQFTYQGREYKIAKEWKWTNSSNLPSIREDNYLQFTVFGKTYNTEAIPIRKNPVKSIEIVENPKKTIYVGDTNTTADLYGGVFCINYTSGSKQEVCVTEHTDTVTVERDGYTLEGKIETLSSGEAENPNWQKYLTVFYMGQSVKLSVDLPLEQEMANAGGFSSNGQAKVTLTEARPYQVLKFTPEETRKYYLYCRTYEDNSMNAMPYLEIYQDSQNIYSMPCSDNDNYNYGSTLLREGLEAGKEYYFVIGYSNLTADATYQFYISSEVESLEELGTPEMVLDELQPGKTEWYEYEMENPYLTLSGTTYQLKYTNGWTVDKKITSSVESLIVNGHALSVKYKHIDKDKSWFPEIRDDNAIIYQYGDGNEVLEKEFSIKLNVKSDVESITIDKNPYENCYADEIGSRSPAGLSVTLHYKKSSGEKDTTITWEDDVYMKEVNGHPLDVYVSSDSGVYNLIVRYMGMEYKEPITVKERAEEPEKTVVGFVLDKKPEKTGFTTIENAKEPDLHGMELTIQYGNDTEKKVTVTEHSDEIKLENGTYVYGSIKTERVKDEEGNTKNVKVLYLTCEKYKQKVMEYEELGFPSKEAVELKAGEVKYIVLGKSKTYALYKITAEADSKYTFYADGKINRYVSRYDASGKDIEQAYGSYSSYSSSECKMSFDMLAGETNYFLVKLNTTGKFASIACRIEGGEIQKTAIDSIAISAENPVVGQGLPSVSADIFANYTVESFKWYNDTNEDGKADFATAYRLKLTISPNFGYCFTKDTSVTIGDTVITTNTLESNGKMTIYYTFPYTECKLTFPEISGYTLHTDMEGVQDRIAYDGTCTFWYEDSNGEKLTDWLVKMNDYPLTVSKDGCYTMANIKENVTVTVKKQDTETNEQQSRLLFYNRSETICDAMIGTKNKTIAENENGETYLPKFASYTDESMQFFYGWYTEKDEALNGINTRFTRNTTLLKEQYDLYAKWGEGIFSTTVNDTEVRYKVLSFDDENRMKVQVVSVSSFAAKNARGSSRAAAGADEAVLEIPKTLRNEEVSLFESLGIDIESCTVASLAPEAFAECDFLSQIVIPDTITEIPERAFAGCKNLTVTLPDTIMEIDDTAFEQTENATVICSSEQASELSEILTDANLTIKTVDFVVEDGKEQKTFSYGQSPESITVKVSVNGEEIANPTVSFEYTDTDAFVYEPNGNMLMVTPQRVTSENETVIVTVKEKISGMQKFISLCTVPADLEEKDNNGTAIYQVEVTGNCVYSGKNICPTVEVKKTATGDILKEADYKVEFFNNKNAGMASYQITGTGNCIGSLKGTFVIEKAEQTITATDLVKKVGDARFSLGAKTNGDGKLTYVSYDATVADVYEDGMVCIYGEGETTISIRASETENYKASKTKKITLTVKPAKDTTENKLEVSKTFYTKVYKSKAFQLKASSNLPITYKSSNEKVATVSKTGKVTIKKCGTAIITVRTSTEKKKVTIQVVPRQTTVKAVSKKAGELKVSWTRRSEAAGYVVEYSTDKKFKKNVSKKNISKNKTTSITLKKLSEGKKYYVRVKAYTMNGKKKVYGKVSETVAQKVYKPETKGNSLSVSKTFYSKVYKSKAFQLKASSNLPITYKSNNEKVATVSKTGKVTIKKCGIATITVRTSAKKKAVTIQVVPRQTTVKTASKKSGELKVNWTKRSEAAGYVVEYSTDKNFKEKVSKKVISKNKTSSITLKKLSKGKKYYVRVTAYTMNGKKKVYGQISETAVQKVKK